MLKSSESPRYRRRKQYREPRLVRNISAQAALPCIPEPSNTEMAQRGLVEVMGRRFDGGRPFLSVRLPGQTLECIVQDFLNGLRDEGVYSDAQLKRLMRYAGCRVNGVEIPREYWGSIRPEPGSAIEIMRRVMGGGGGGGKNPLATILGLVVTIVSIAVPFLAPASWGLVAATGGLTLLGGVVSAGIMVLGGLAVNALFPTAAPSIGSAQLNDAGQISQTYSISGSQNAANPYGYVPLILGRHRVTPPLAAKSWTKWEGDKQFFNMCVCWGHPDVEVSDFKIEKTPLGNYKNVEHVFHRSTTGDDLKLFAKSYNEQSVGATLKASEGWVTRTVGEAEDLSFDIVFQGLTTINQENGKSEWRTVTFQAQYKKKDEEGWNNVVAGSRVEIRGKTQVVDGLTFFGGRKPKVYADWNGNISIGYDIGGDIQIYPNKSPYISGCNVNISYPGGENKTRVEVSNGVFDNRGVIEISGAQATLLVRNFRVEGLPRAIYEAQWRRITPDNDSQYIRDEAVWQTMRAILNRPAFNAPVPICVSELRIQASEQLSNYVSQFNALCESNIPDYDAESDQWPTRLTRNPASLYRYLLTSPQTMRRPYSENKLDEQSLKSLHAWCVERGYTYDYVADSEESTWSRLTSVLSAARAGVDFTDGLYGAVVDAPGKEPGQLFTPRNSWGFKLERSFFEMPHALRVKWVNANDDYNQTENFIYADGYSRENAVNIVEWEYPGVTEWESLYKMGRYHLAKMLHRQIKVTLNTDWEWLKVRRGGLVSVASDVLMNIFGTARIQGLLYLIEDEEDGKIEILVYAQEDIPLDETGMPLAPIGCEIDDSIIFSDPSQARYGIAIRDNTARLSVYEIEAAYGKENSLLRFAYPLSIAQTPPFDALVSVSILGDEYAEYLVASIAPGENLSAELTLIPYAIDEIEAAAEGEIPPYEPPIHLPSISGEALPTPVITAIRSDESVLIRSATGSIIPRIAVWWQMGTGNAEAGLSFQLIAKHVDKGTQASGTASSLEEFVAAQGVDEGEVYDVRIRAINPSTGRTSAWSTPIRHKVIGRTTPPPAPSGVFLNGYSISIEQLNRPLDVVGHKIFMAMDENDDISMALELTNPYTATGTFDLTPWAGRARAIFVRTVDELGLLSDPVRIVVNLGDVLPDNVLFEFSERERAWSGEITGGYVSNDTLFADESAHLWPQSDAVLFWQQGDALPLWPSGNAVTLLYVWQVDIPEGYFGARVLVLPNAVSGRLQKLEFRHYKEPVLWEQDDAAYLWPQPEVSVGADGQDESVEPYLWPQPEVSAWEVMPNNYVTPGGETLEFRIAYSNSEQAQLLDIITVLDVEDKELALEDIAVSASGATRIKLPSSYFRAITNVVFGLQYIDSSTAVSVQRVSGSEIMGTDGYLTDGPIIKAITAAGSLTTANCDIRIKGY